MESNENNTTKQIAISVSVLVAIALIVGATLYTGIQGKAKSGSATSMTASITPDPQTKYRDGTYDADSSYQSPGGTEGISVKITIANNVVTDASVTARPSENEAKLYQDMFLKAYKGKVVGKAVNSIHLSRVSGSSLTSEGFNSALAKIQQQAKV
jgi:uncharacterized protein with FMN-binding domain